MANGAPDWTDGLVFDPETEEALRALRSPFADVLGPKATINPSVGAMRAGLDITADELKAENEKKQRAAELAGTAGYTGPIGKQQPVPASFVPDGLQFDAGTEASLAGLPPWTGEMASDAPVTAPPAQFAEPDWETGQQQAGAVQQLGETAPGAPVEDPFAADPLQAAMQKRTNAQAAQDDIYATGLERMAKTDAEMALDNEAARQRRDQAVRKDQADLDADVAEMSTRKADPGWEGNAANIIGLILGGLFQARTGKTNPAIALLQQQIDNSARAFDQNMGRDKAVLGMRESSLDRTVAMNDDATRAADAARLDTIGRLKGGIQAEMAKYASTITQANGAEAIAMLDAAEAKLRAERAFKIAEAERKAELERQEIERKRQADVLQYKASTYATSAGRQSAKEANENVRDNMVLDDMRAGRGQENALQLKEMELRAQGNTKEADKIKDERERTVSYGGNVVQVKDKEARTQVDAKMINAAKVANRLDKLLELQTKWKGQKYGDDDTLVAERILGDLQVLYAVSNEQGAISASDLETYKRIMGGTTSGIIDLKPKWRSLRQQYEEDINLLLDGSAVGGDAPYFQIPVYREGAPKGGENAPGTPQKFTVGSNAADMAAEEIGKEYGVDPSLLKSYADAEGSMRAVGTPKNVKPALDAYKSRKAALDLEIGAQYDAGKRGEAEADAVNAAAVEAEAKRLEAAGDTQGAAELRSMLKGK